MSEFLKKPEKIASALYLITSFLDDQEPLKWKLRSLASEFVSLGILIRDNLFKGREAVILKARNLVLEMSSQLSVARNVGLISDTNYSILNQELTKYLDLLGLPAGTLEVEGKVALPPNFFSGEAKGLREMEKEETASLKDKIEQRQTEYLAPVAIPASAPLDKGQSSHRPVSDLKEFGAVSVKKNSRQSTIIAILKRKKEIMIKDVVPLISGCSEKTIQRELSAMVQSGILKKVGEKRWSRYTLA